MLLLNKLFDTTHLRWSYGVMVSTPDSESGNPSSNLGRTCDNFFFVSNSPHWLQFINWMYFFWYNYVSATHMHTPMGYQKPSLFAVFTFSTHHKSNCSIQFATITSFTLLLFTTGFQLTIYSIFCTEKYSQETSDKTEPVIKGSYSCKW